MKYIKWILRLILSILSVLLFLMNIEKGTGIATFSLVMMLVFTFLSTHPLGLFKPQYSNNKIQDYQTGVFLVSGSALIAGIAPSVTHTAYHIMFTGLIVALMLLIGIKFIIQSKKVLNAA